ncbi:MAG: adenine deaminase [Niastella sp. SCN 39-18]|nr:adenine deaminase [Sphingobacteriales bacterium]ODT54114.1 MAG: adenine deaminase [Niastella sp. SCN 39-18]OJW09994.1 MAG: adenine deaminase [Sphingobacteriales bacterium 39-19]
MLQVEGNIVDIENKKIGYGILRVHDGKINDIEILGNEKTGSPYILPGLIDSHVHIESSMLVPSEFAKLAVVHGSTGTISDPHEIANVCGMEGVKFMIENGNTVPFKFHFGAPSCVPATLFETAGASLDAGDVTKLLAMPEIHYLSEMMNFPGVLNQDEEVMKKIAAAKNFNKPVDGHAPGLRGEDAKKYIEAGISTDHECFTAEEALGKLKFGMKILIREGSAAKNFDALIPLMHDHFENMMFCSDDKHPDSLEISHINALCARAVAYGIDVFKVLQAACINPVKHYNMHNGLLKPGDAADFIVVDDLIHFKVLQTYIDGALVAENGTSFIKTQPSQALNQFNCSIKKVADFALQAKNNTGKLPVIEALDGQLITTKLYCTPNIRQGMLVSNPAEDILKIVVVNRYKDAPIAISFIKNTGIKQGAMASSVAHDSHNIVAVGVDDTSLCQAVNLVIQNQGGISALANGIEKSLALPVAGLMSTDDGYSVSKAYTEIDQFTKNEMASTLTAPFMTLSFMALLVIPHLKLSDMGLFDGDKFEFVP